VAVVNSPAAVAETLDRLLATTRDRVCTVMDVSLPADRRAQRSACLNMVADTTAVS
jgi:hypothetical protein